MQLRMCMYGALHACVANVMVAHLQVIYRSTSNDAISNTDWCILVSSLFFLALIHRSLLIIASSPVLHARKIISLYASIALQIHTRKHYTNHGIRLTDIQVVWY